jgi:hypothetical protein
VAAVDPEKPPTCDTSCRGIKKRKGQPATKLRFTTNDESYGGFIYFQTFSRRLSGQA